MREGKGGKGKKEKRKEIRGRRKEKGLDSQAVIVNMMDITTHLQKTFPLGDMVIRRGGGGEE